MLSAIMQLKVRNYNEENVLNYFLHSESVRR